MKESELRDALEQNIEIIELGLTLIKKEKYIPNSLGTRSFIDLYAKDQNGHHVLIELKRSDEASREAIHELHKYVQSVKSYLGARDDEIRVIVASTHWKELLVPFSRLLEDTKLSITGLNIEVNLKENIIRTSPIRPLEMNYGRFIAPWHSVYWYSNQENLDTGISSIESSWESKGMEDYVIAIIGVPDEFTNHQQEALVQSLIASTGMTDDEAANMPTLPKHNFIAYVASQMPTESQCLNIIRSKNVPKEDLEDLVNIDGIDRIGFLYDIILNIRPYPWSEYAEIGTPAKFDALMEIPGFTLVDIKRYGAFSRNNLLKDDDILSDLHGYAGQSKQKLVRAVDTANRAHVSHARDSINACLADNSAWRHQMTGAFDEICIDFPDSEVSISISNPSMGIFTIYYMIKEGDIPSYLPHYTISLDEGNVKRFYYGCLVREGRVSRLDKILRKYYDSDLIRLLMTMRWGGYQPNDVDIMEDLGLVYETYKIEVHNNIPKHFRFKNGRWKINKSADPILEMKNYISDNESVLIDMYKKIALHDKGIFFEYF